MSAFATTRWSIVRAARADSAHSRGALNELCAIYKGPISAYLGRYRFDGLERDDAVQEFFAQFLEAGVVEKADSARGSFRAYLLTALRHFVARQLEAQSAQKRGRTIEHDALDVAGDLAASEDEMPETVFHREWATLTLNQALGALRAEAEAAGKLSLFERTSSFMAEDADRDEYQRIAMDLGVRPNTVAVAVFRLRERFRVLVRREVAQTVDSQSELADELARLRLAIGA